LRQADHRLSVTVCHRHPPTADREMNYRLSRQTRHQHPAAGRSRDPRCPAYPYLNAARQSPVMADRPVTGSPGRCARVPSWDDARRRVERVVERRGGNPSTASAVSAIIRVICAANAPSGLGRGYGKETLRMIPCRGAPVSPA
jgi:hypothetical protein